MHLLCWVILTAVFTFGRYLTEKEAVAAVGYTHRAYAIAAWRFLTKTGFINFGVAPGMSAKQGSSSEPPKGTVIVVGAGMAGTQFASCGNILHDRLCLAGRCIHFKLLWHALSCFV